MPDLPINNLAVYFTPIFRIIFGPYLWVKILEVHSCYVYAAPYGHCKEKSETINIFLQLLSGPES